MSTVPLVVAGVVAVVGAVGVKTFAGEQAGGLSAMVGLFLAIAVYTVVKDLTKPKQIKNVDEGFDDLDEPAPVVKEAPKAVKKKKSSRSSNKKKKAAAAAQAASAPAVKKVAPAPVKKEEVKVVSKSAKAKAKAKRQAANKKSKKPMDETSLLLAEAARLKGLADEAAAKAEQAQRLLNAAAAATSGGKKGKKGRKAAAAAAIEVKAAPRVRAPVVEEEGWTTMKATKSSKERREEAQAKLAEETAARRLLNGGVDDDEDVETGPVKPEAELEMKINAKHYGAIIGKGGANLQLLQSALGVHISMPKKGTDDTNVKISGSSAAVEACEVALNELVQLGYSSITHPDTMNQSIDVPEKYHSILIGQKGANIKAIQQKTETRINMPEKGGDSTLVTITGAIENVMMAKTAIKQLMNQGYSDLTHEGWASVDMHFPSARMSDLIGSGGSTIRSIQKDTGCRIDTPGPSSVSQNTITITGPADKVEDCRARVTELSVVEEVEQDPAWAEDNEYDLVSINSWD